MSKLLDKVRKAGSIASASILGDSPFFKAKDMITTDLPILNIAFSGEVDGGLVPGLTVLGGASKSYKTMLGLYCMKAYLDKYQDGIAIIYDSEFSITPEYLASHGIDPHRVLHVPIEHIEQLKFDMVKRLEEIERGDKVYFLIDSIGSLSSKKEIDDAKDEKSVADMTRAKALRSFLRIITPPLTMKDLPCVAINHIYQTMELYSKAVVSGGTAVMYCANQVFIITKAQEKDATGIVGWHFTINIEKSRFVREKAKFPFLVTYEGGISKYSGLMDIALESGDAIKPSNGWYNRVDKTTGEVIQPKLRFADTDTAEFWEPILASETFRQHVRDSYALSSLKGLATPDPLPDDEDEEAFG